MVFFVRLGGATSKIFLMFTPPKNGGKWFNPSYFFSDKGWFNCQLEDDFFHHFSSGIPWSHLQLRRRPLQSSKRTDRRRWRRCNVNSANGKYRSPRGAGMWSPSFCETFVRLDSWPLKTLKSEVFLLKFFFCILLTIFVPNKSNTSSLGGFGWRKFLCSAWDRAWGSKAASRAREAATREAAEQATAVAAKNPLGN